MKFFSTLIFLTVSFCLMLIVNGAPSSVTDGYDEATFETETIGCEYTYTSAPVDENELNMDF